MNQLQRTFALSITSLAFAGPAFSAEETVKPVTSKSISNMSAWRASDLIGSDVKNTTNEDIGEIEDILIDPKTGKISAVIVSAGGFLGLADTLSSVPPAAFRYDSESKSFVVSLTKNELESGEKFSVAEWKAGASEKLKEARNAVGGDVTKPDNSANNERDRENNTMTPEDQGDSDADLKLTKDIRSAVVGSDLSFNAKNVKIISNDGQVVLRGVVDSKEEHEAVLKLAKDKSNGAKVTDQIEVKK